MRTTKVPKKFLRNPIHFLALGFGSGLIPVMPGTFGTLVGVLLYLFLFPLSVFNYSILLGIMILAGFFLRSSADIGLWIFDVE